MAGRYLGDALYAFGKRHRPHAYVPICPARNVAALSGFLSANGFVITHRRTKHARILRIWMAD